jgi:hypothetical protein
MAIPFAHELNQLVTIQTASGGRNLRGSRVTLTTYTTAWARVMELGGSMEEVTMNVQAATKGFEIWIRHADAPALTGNHQILWGTRALFQTAPPTQVIDGANRRWWQISAGEKTEFD